MADVKISGLTAKGATLEATDELEINEAGTSKKVTGQQIVDLVPAASDTVAGIVELATDAEGITGTDTAKAVTPANVTAVLQAPGKFTGSTKGADIASASPLVIGTDGDMFDVTGTTAFAAMTVAANRLFILQWDGIVTVTHGASLVLPGGANLTTAAGDVWTCYSTAADTVIVTNVATAAAAGGGGAWNLIGTVVASNSASLTITGLDSTYDTYAVAFSDIVPATNNVDPLIRFGDSSGIDSGAKDYAWANSSKTTSAGQELYEGLGSDTNGSPYILIDTAFGIGNSAGEGFDAFLTFRGPSDQTTWSAIQGDWTMRNDTGNRFYHGSTTGFRKAVISVDRIQLAMSSGNITSGRMTIWGISHD